MTVSSGHQPQFPAQLRPVVLPEVGLHDREIQPHRSHRHILYSELQKLLPHFFDFGDDRPAPEPAQRPHMKQGIHHESVDAPAAAVRSADIRHELYPMPHTEAMDVRKKDLIIRKAERRIHVRVQNCRVQAAMGTKRRDRDVQDGQPVAQLHTLCFACALFFHALINGDRMALPHQFPARPIS